MQNCGFFSNRRFCILVFFLQTIDMSRRDMKAYHGMQTDRFSTNPRKRPSGHHRSRHKNSTLVLNMQDVDDSVSFSVYCAWMSCKLLACRLSLRAPCKCLQILAWRPLASHHQRPRQRFSEWRVGPLFNILYFGRWATLLYIVFSVIYCGILCHHAVW